METLRKFISETLASGRRKISAGSDYMVKERVRESIQNLLVGVVRGGGVNSQEELDEWWKTVEISIKSLRLIPFEIVKRM